MRSIRIGIVGCGLIGHKRAQALGPGILLGCTDLNKERAESLAKKHPECQVYEKWEDLVKSPEVDMVIVATQHASLAEITKKAIEAGKHVFVEKPAARTLSEIEELKKLLETKDVKPLIRVGFNHRYHKALLKAREVYDSGCIGESMFIRGRYGHGGRIGYDKEWRADPKLSGGGELIDQGPHLIDLSRWFLGEFVEVSGVVRTYYWDMPVDDNAFMTLQTANKKTAFLHVSCSEWKNTFSLELYCTNGKIEICGLGGSYGVETLKLYKMLPEMGPPETTIWEYPMQDTSWNTELQEFYEDIELNRTPSAGLAEALAVHRVIDTLYKQSGYTVE